MCVCLNRRGASPEVPVGFRTRVVRVLAPRILPVNCHHWWYTVKINYDKLPQQKPMDPGPNHHRHHKNP